MFMWSASASESSGVIGPTSRRMRPRLSSRRVRSTGSAGRSTASLATCTTRSYVHGYDAPRAARPPWGSSLGVGWASPEALLRRSASLRLETARSRRRRRRRRHPATRHGERLPQLLDEPLDRELAVPELTPLVLGDRAENGACTGEHATLLNVRQRRGRLHVEQCLDPRRRLLSVLAAGPTRARDADLDLRDGQRDGARDADPLRRRQSRPLRYRSPPSSLRLVDSRSMACILLDIDGVLHVSGEPISGAQEAVSELREAGHAIRFVTNNSTRPRAGLAAELREMGFTLEDAELQTTPGTAARELAGKRVLALVMVAIVPDLEGLELVGHDADAVLVGGCDETLEPNQVFSYMNMARAFSEIRMGAEFYCLHKNKWWQTSRGPMLDSGAFTAGLEYATGVEAVVLGKPSPSYFAVALDALDAEPERTWLVTDDVEAAVPGARLFGMRTALVRTGKFRPEALEGAEASPDIVVSSIAQFPAWLESDLSGGVGKP